MEVLPTAVTNIVYIFCLFVIVEGQLTQCIDASSQTNLVLQILTAPTSAFVNAVRICKSFTVHGMINVKILY